MLSGVAVVAACLVHRTNTPRDRLPALIRRCETGVEHHCGTWTLVDGAEGTYRGTWDQGTRAELQVHRFDGDRMEVSRVDVEVLSNVVDRRG